MAKQMIQIEEFSRIYNLIVAVPIKKDESDNKYFQRLLVCGAGRSRRTLQLIVRAMKDTDCVDDAYALYKELSRERKHQKKKAGQQKMDLTDHETTEDNPPRKLKYMIEIAIYEY